MKAAANPGQDLDFRHGDRYEGLRRFGEGWVGRRGRGIYIGSVANGRDPEVCQHGPQDHQGYVSHPADRADGCFNDRSAQGSGRFSVHGHPQSAGPGRGFAYLLPAEGRADQGLQGGSCPAERPGTLADQHGQDGVQQPRQRRAGLHLRPSSPSSSTKKWQAASKGQGQGQEQGQGPWQRSRQATRKKGQKRQRQKRQERQERQKTKETEEEEEGGKAQRQRQRQEIVASRLNTKKTQQNKNKKNAQKAQIFSFGPF